VGEDRNLHERTGGFDMNAIAANIVGLDLAKNVFQAYWIESETGEIRNVPIKRAKLIEHFANRAWSAWRLAAVRSTGPES
jgi:hypothetical protein